MNPQELGADGRKPEADKGGWYIPRKGPIKSIYIEAVGVKSAKVLVGDDPFSVIVPINQISSCKPTGDIVKLIQNNKVLPKGTSEMPTKTATKPKAKELQKEARGLGIKGYEDMGLSELREAVEGARNGRVTSKPKKRPKQVVEAPAPKAKAKKIAPKAAKTVAKAKKAPAKKVGAKRKTPGGLGATKDSIRVLYPPAGTTKATEKVNPFRKGSNLHNVPPLLFKGGKRQDLATKLANKVEIHPYHKDADKIDLLDYDKRILLAAQTMRDKFGFGILRKGRGMDGTVKVFVPGSSDDPEVSGKAKATKAGSKKPAKAAKK